MYALGNLRDLLKPYKSSHYDAYNFRCNTPQKKQKRNKIKPTLNGFQRSQNCTSHNTNTLYSFTRERDTKSSGNKLAHLSRATVARHSLEGLKRSRSTPTRWSTGDRRWASCAVPRRGAEVLYVNALQPSKASP